MNLIEPADLSFVRTGKDWPFTFWWRDDKTAIENECKPDRRWWDVSDEDDGPFTWEQVCKWPEPCLVRFEDLKENA